MYKATVLKNNPRERFEAAMLPHLGAAYNLARWLTRDDDDARDVVQEAFLRAYRFFDSYRGEHARAWLLTVVRNTFFTLKSAQLAQPQEEFDENLVEHDRAGRQNGFDDPALATQRAEDVATLNAAIDALPIEFREVIVLREIEGCSYKEIAHIVGTPIGTVMSRLSRARGLLQRLLVQR